MKGKNKLKNRILAFLRRRHLRSKTDIMGDFYFTLFCMISGNYFEEDEAE